jgi:hypothetical protein
VAPGPHRGWGRTSTRHGGAYGCGDSEFHWGEDGLGACGGGGCGGKAEGVVPNEACALVRISPCAAHGGGVYARHPSLAGKPLEKVASAGV